MWSYWNCVILRPPKVEIHRSTVYHLRIVLKWAHGSVQNYLANIMSACIKLLSIEEAWRLEIVKGRSYKLNMMAFANKIQSQTQLSLKLLIFWVCTSVGHVDIGANMWISASSATAWPTLISTRLAIRSTSSSHLNSEYVRLDVGSCRCNTLLALAFASPRGHLPTRPWHAKTCHLVLSWFSDPNLAQFTHLGKGELSPSSGV